VPSENVETSVPDRRTRKRQARRDHLLDLAADLVERHGVDGVTMAALAESADYAPASLYTYFPSRSALLAALQQRALGTLAAVARDCLAGWDRALRDLEQDPPASTIRIHALARLWAFSDLFLSAPDEHPREFRLQQQLLVTPGAEDTEDAATVVPAAMSVLEAPRRLLGDAVHCGALAPHRVITNPLGEPLDGDVLRTFAWTVALNGALMVDTLTTGLPSTGAALGTEITASLLIGWGAAPDELATGRELATRSLTSNTWSTS
jgi:AcrR family transcriptional regulator